MGSSCSLRGCFKNECKQLRGREVGAALIESSVLLALVLTVSIGSLVIAGNNMDASIKNAARAFHLSGNIDEGILGDSDSDHPLVNK